MKFVILLHQTLDGYATLFQVYEHVINADKLRAHRGRGATSAPSIGSESTSASTCSPQCSVRGRGDIATESNK